MKSIRRRLLAWLLSGLALLCLGAGLSVYLVVQRSLYATFDAELNILASEVRYLFPANEDPEHAASTSDRWLNFFVPDSGQYFEVWDEDLLFSDPSPSLQGMQLPLPETDTNTTAPVIFSAQLKNGEPVRGLARQITLPATEFDEGYTLNIVVALNRVDLDARLRTLLLSTFGIGLVILAGSTLIVHFAVAWGLHPLLHLGRQVEHITPENLHERFSDEAATELQPVIARLNELMHRLEAGFERERRFSSDLAHELRTPVAELKTLAEVALQWPEQAGPENYEDVLSISRQLQHTIEILLMLARTEQAGGPESVEDVALRSLIESSMATYAQEAQERQLRFDLAVEESLTWTTHPGLLEVIVSNLVSNAVAYAPEGSCIHIGTENSSVLTISNPAPDLDADDVSQLFERLWRKDHARSSGDAHAGLGLPLAQSCAKTLGLILTASLDPSRKILSFSLKKAD